MTREKITILQDTREQTPFKFRPSVNFNPTVVQTIHTGDYSFLYKGKDFTEEIVFDRKTGSDLAGTLSSGYVRFRKEINRAIEKGTKFYIIVECSYSDFKNKKFKGGWAGKRKGYDMTKQLATLEAKYGVIVKFFNTKSDAQDYIREVFRAHAEVYDKKNV